MRLELPVAANSIIFEKHKNFDCFGSQLKKLQFIGFFSIIVN
jgi:hypothetical protein